MTFGVGKLTLPCGVRKGAMGSTKKGQRTQIVSKKMTEHQAKQRQ